MDFSAFSHGQIHSKLWLCNELERFIQIPVNTVIVGCWYNVLGFLMVSRKQHLYSSITGVDCNSDAITIANKICDFQMINENQKIKNIVDDVDNIDFTNYDLVICTSVEDIASTTWYDKIPENKLVCVQSINLSPESVEKYPNWHILNPNKNFLEFTNKYPVTQTLFNGIKEFDYGDLKYNRYMVIGYK